MQGDTDGYETTSFGGENKFFFNYFNREFLTAAFDHGHLVIQNEWLQDYPNPDHAILKDMIFILEKTAEPH